MIKINYKSDFKINESSETVAMEVPFVFSYYVFDNKKYVVSFDGHNYVNCERKEDGSLDVIFNQPEFGIGHLKVERKYAVDDKAFADGVFDVVTVDKTDVFITSGNTFETYVKTLVVPPYLKGDKGDPMTWSTMTETEREELVHDVAEAIDPEMVMTENEKSRQEAEQSRQAAEQQRSTTFNTLKGEMQSAITAGNAAAENAQKVVDEYDTKVAEQDSKLSELGSIAETKRIDYASAMTWNVVNNNSQNTTNYITNVEFDGNKVLLYPSGSGTNFAISIYIGTPEEGENVTVKMKLANANSPSIRKNVTSTSHGIELHALALENGIYSTTFKADGSPIYLFFLVLWSASTSKPVEVSDFVLVGNKTTLIGDFVSEDDLIKNNLLLIPKGKGSYNQGSGVLEDLSNRFGTGLVKVKEGLLLKTEGVDKPYIVYLDKNLSYKGYIQPTVWEGYGGIFSIPNEVEYIAITTYTDFNTCYITKIDASAQYIIPVIYKEADFQPYMQVPKLLRRNGVMVRYALPSGENVIEVFKDPGNINLDTNSFGVAKFWKRLAYTDIQEGMYKHPMKGKTFYSIGDSHRWKWLKKLAEITDSISGGDIFSYAIDAYEKHYVSRTVAMAKYIVDLYKSGKPVDYIFLEYTHKYFTNTVAPSNAYYYSGDIEEAEPFLTQAYYDFTEKVFDNSVKAKEYWDANFQSIVGRYTPKSNAIIALKVGIKVQQPKFRLAGSSTNSGNFTIKFIGSDGTTKQMSIAIPSGLGINEALTIVNEIEFADSGSLWDNLSAHSTINDATLKFTYRGSSSDADSNVKLTFDFGTTGILHDGDWSIVTETSDWIRGFRSHDVSKWTNTDKWNELYANFDAYIWIKAAVELLQREVPTAKIFVWTLCTEAWNYANNTIGGKSVLYPDGMLNVQAIYDSEEHKRMVQNVEGWEKVAKYYHLGFIPISEINSISPANHKYYYASDDVHPTQEAYDRVAEILAANVY